MSEPVGECAVCGARETVASIELPPRALQLMRHGEGVAWRDVPAPATVRFCEPDWEFVIELVTDRETNPLAQCNATYAEYDLADEEVDHFDLETTMWAEGQAVLTDRAGDPADRDLVAARLVTWSLEALIETGA